MGKVVHVSDDLHDRVKRFCMGKNVNVQSWVSELIVSAIKENRPIPEIRKPKPSGDRRSEQSNVWKQPPFWKSKKS